MSENVTIDSLRALLATDTSKLLASPAALRNFVTNVLQTLNERDVTIETLRRDLHYAINKDRLGDSTASVILSLLRTLPEDEHNEIFSAHATTIIARANETIGEAMNGALSWRNYSAKQTHHINAALEALKANNTEKAKEILTQVAEERIINENVEQLLTAPSVEDNEIWFNTKDTLDDLF